LSNKSRGFKIGLMGGGGVIEFIFLVSIFRWGIHDHHGPLVLLFWVLTKFNFAPFLKFWSIFSSPEHKMLKVNFLWSQFVGALSSVHQCVRASIVNFLYKELLLRNHSAKFDEIFLWCS
jgi:hypothetical protein